MNGCKLYEWFAGLVVLPFVLFLGCFISSQSNINHYNVQYLIPTPVEENESVNLLAQLIQKSRDPKYWTPEEYQEVSLIFKSMPSAKEFQICDALDFVQETLGPESCEIIELGYSLKYQYEEARPGPEISSGMDSVDPTNDETKKTMTEEEYLTLYKKPEAGPTWSAIKTAGDDAALEEATDLTEKLRQRYLKNQIYTFIGPTLISINPYQMIQRDNTSASIYTEETMYHYQNTPDQRLSPHPFYVAKQALQQIVEQNQNQSIVLLGEAGSGTTELSKQIVQYVATVAGVERTAPLRLYTSSTNKTIKMRSDETRTRALLDAKR